MARITCLANIEAKRLPILRLALKRARAPAVVDVAGIEVVTLGKLAPALLVCDVDSLDTDPLEALRQLRFVLPDAIIVVYTVTMKRSWGLRCHVAGANGILSKISSAGELALGLRAAMRDGCFTDPRLAA